MDTTQTPEVQQEPTQKAAPAKPTDLLPATDPILQAWTSIAMILAEIEAPKTRRFRKLRAPRARRTNHPETPLRG